MKQLGNLAMVCAQRPEVLLQIHNGQAAVYAGAGPNRAVLAAAWDNDAEINSIIHELNFGKYASKNPAENPSESCVPPKKCEGSISGSRAVTLINRLIDRMLNDEGGHVKPVIEALLDMDFTSDELIEEFHFSSSDVDECANGPDAPELN